MASQAVMPEESVGEIDEALRYLSLVPEGERGAAWQAYADALLERRQRADRQRPMRETRVMEPAETR